MERQQGLPFGKGFWIHKILPVQQLYGQDGLEMGGMKNAMRHDANGLAIDHLVVKIATNLWRYNLRRPNPAIPLAIYDDLLPALVEAAHDVGTEIWGYAGVTGPSMDNPEKAAEFHARRAKQFGFDGLIANAEGSAWQLRADRYTKAERYASTLKAAVGNMPVGLSTYRYPRTSQPAFPYTQFMRHLDFIKPQVYWVGAHNPVEQLNRSIAQYRTITTKPIVPDGAAYTQSGAGYTEPDGSKWFPTPEDLKKFHDACLSLGLSGYTSWEWWNCVRPYVGLGSAWGGNKWPGQTEPPAPPEISPEEKLSQLWDFHKEKGDV